MMEKISFSWSTIGHKQAKIYCQNTLKNGMLHHALLFSGPVSIGKVHFALDFSQIILCYEYHRSQASIHLSFPCRTCTQCRFCEQHTHPELTYLKAERTKGSPSISVDQIRELKTKLVLKATYGSKKIVIIENVDALTLGAANALLKLLEEPTQHTHFLLTTSQKERLLPTIKSRVPILHLSHLSDEEIRNALLQKNVSPSLANELTHLAHGRIGIALRFLEQPSLRPTHQQWIDQILLTIGAHPIETFHNLPTVLPSKDRPLSENQDLLFYWFTLFRDLLILRSQSQIPLIHEPHRNRLMELSQRMTLPSLMQAFNDLSHFREPEALSQQPQLRFENLLLSLIS